MDIPDFPIPPQNHQSAPAKNGDGADEDEKKQAQQAADLIRQKLDTIYTHEPDARAEVNEIVAQGQPTSRHQQYMFELSNSGKSVAEIQTAWHNYYQNLSDSDKRDVWDEFYSQNKHKKVEPNHLPDSHEGVQVTTVSMPAPDYMEAATKPRKASHSQATRTVADYKHHLARQSKVKQKLTARHHFQSLVFGLGTGAFVVLLLLFGFFNERFIAPFITPSRHVNSTPIITDPNSMAVGTNPEIIIPKINVEIPVVYNEPSIADAAMETALERGVVHYATTPNPGQQGNVVIFGHSSNNIFNPGKYKFAFVLLSKLNSGDLFYLDKGGKRYVYKVYKKRIVEPTEVGVLSTADKPDTATLITCDPPGTSLHRLVVTGEQISPATSTNTASTAIKANNQPTTIPSNSLSLWQRFVDWL